MERNTKNVIENEIELLKQNIKNKKQKLFELTPKYYICKRADMFYTLIELLSYDRMLVKKTSDIGITLNGVEIEYDITSSDFKNKINKPWEHFNDEISNETYKWLNKLCEEIVESTEQIIDKMHEVNKVEYFTYDFHKDDDDLYFIEPYRKYIFRMEYNEDHNEFVMLTDYLGKTLPYQAECNIEVHYCGWFTRYNFQKISREDYLYLHDMFIAHYNLYNSLMKAMNDTINECRKKDTSRHDDVVKDLNELK